MKEFLGDQCAFVTESIKVPVIAESDVVVCGGGPSGVAAAIAAARQGVSVILLERYGFLGGEMTAGLVVSPADTDSKGGIVDEFLGNLRKRGALSNKNVLEPEQTKILLDEMVVSSGARILFHAYASRAILEEGRVTGIITETKQGRVAVKARVVIDCTGDGDVSASANVPFVLGRERDGAVQAATMMFRIGGSSFEREYRAHVRDMARAAMEKGEQDLFFDTPAYFRLPKSESGIFGWSHVRKKNPIDAFQLSEIELESRKQIGEIMEFIKTRIPVFSNVELVQTAVKTGIRESRHILGEYVLTEDDVKSGREFDDAIVRCFFPIDIHSDEHLGIDGQEVQPYTIPYRCLIPQVVDNLIVAGRCISADHVAASSFRVIGPCFIMGQAAGLAAAIAVKENTLPREIHGVLVREKLRLDGVHI